MTPLSNDPIQRLSEQAENPLIAEGVLMGLVKAREACERMFETLEFGEGLGAGIKCLRTIDELIAIQEKKVGHQ